MKKRSHIPDLLEVQRSSFCWFLTEGLGRELAKFSYTFDINQTFELRIYGDQYCLTEPSLNIRKAKELGTNFSVEVYLTIEVVEKYDEFNQDLLQLEEEFALAMEEWEEEFETEELSPVGIYKIFLTEIPLMTEKCTFIINGCERVIISQLIRSPGVYYKIEKKKKKKKNQDMVYSATVITKRGSWFTVELDGYAMWAKIDKKHKMPLHWFLQSMELTDKEIYRTIRNTSFLAECAFLMDQELDEKREKTLRRQNKTIDPRKAKASALRQVKDLVYAKIFNSSYYDLGEIGRIQINQKLDISLPLHLRILTSLDILKIVDSLIDFKVYRGQADEIDSLTNRRVRCVGELVKMQVGVGLGRLFRNIDEKILNDELNLLDINKVMNPKPVGSAIKEFFGSSQLSQFLDETNPLAELTHKRRVTSLGPGGLNADHVSFSARDIHPTQYGRLCPIETPEGQSAGLVSSFATHAKVNSYGFLQTPFFPVRLGRVRKDLTPVYLTAEEELRHRVVAADTKISRNNSLIGDIVAARYNNEYILAAPHQVDFMSISTVQLISIGAALIPFLEHDDANRALMGSNMQRQAVPLLYPQKPIVGTGLEAQIGLDSACGVVSLEEGQVEVVTSDHILISQSKETWKRYELEKFRRSNQDTCVNQRPLVWPGQWVQVGELLADGPAMEEGELALGQNLTVAYLPWEGYNYEDAILVSDRLVSHDSFTSIHIEEFEIEVRQTETGVEQLTCYIPNTSSHEVRHLTPAGIVYKGALVESGDVLVGKVTPKDESEEIPEGKLLRAIFGDKSFEVRDSSFRVPRGMQGRILDVLVFSKEKGHPLPYGTLFLIRIFLAEIRKLKIGDKISGRHGNKGIVSKIVPIPDMPFLPDGTVVDVILNPLGVPSRMNVGQIFESLLGFAGQYSNKRFHILPFDELYGPETSRIFVNNRLRAAAVDSQNPWVFNPSSPGRIILRDGRTGETFDNPIMVGKSYLLKLIHLVDDKMHARSTGPYSLVTQQPVGGKAQQGGQRFGEMEVWALEAYGAAYILQELLTIKSDDVDGRNDALTAIIKGKSLPQPGVPESFKVLLRELHSLGLNITTYGLRTNLEPVEINLMYTTSTLKEKQKNKGRGKNG